VRFPRRTSLLVLAATLTLTIAPGVARSSASFGDRGIHDAALSVSRSGLAVVAYTTAAGGRRHVLVWGAVDALANPTLGEAQQHFTFDYSGGWKSHGSSRYWQRVRNACRPYDGPRLPFFVAGCKAADGSYWALQEWQRNLPMRGFDPWTEQQRAAELHVSHWTGDLPELQIGQHWTYAHAHQGFFGRFVYRGAPVYGTRTPSATVRDEWARNITIDSLDSSYGSGWKRDTSIAAHRGNGGFCYTFVPQPPPAGYPKATPNGNGLGERYRVSAMGPGVTPIVQWEGPRLGAFDAALQAEATRLFDELLGGDAHCARER
jgi:hypothetical protein